MSRIVHATSEARTMDRGSEESWSPNDIDEVREKTKALHREDVIVCLVGVYEKPSKVSREIARTCMSSAARCTTIAANSIPNPLDHFFLAEYRETWREKLQRLMRVVRMRPRRWVRFLKRHPFFIKIVKSRKPSTRYALEHIWLGGAECPVSLRFMDASTKVRVVHSLDIDLLDQGDGMPRERLPILFIDSMGPLHPDYELLGIRPALDPDTYFNLICRTLTRIEEATGNPIVIAAHPRAKPHSLDGHFGDRRVLYGSTARAVADADWIIAAGPTTAIGWAVALHKPISFLVSERFETNSRLLTAEMIKVLAAGTVRAEDQDVSGQAPEVDIPKYLRYTDRYLGRKDLFPTPFWHAVLKDLGASQ